MTVTIVVEGETDRPVAHKLALDAGFPLHTIYNARGKPNLDRDLLRYNQAARTSPWFVLRDLDADQRCPGEVVSALVRKPGRWMALRLAVREMESWLLADAPALARFLGVPPSRIPTNPDAEPDPKQSLVNLARRSSSRELRSMAPQAGHSSPVGPLYASAVIRFATNYWSVDRAEEHSESLRRARAALRTLAKSWRHHAGH